MNKLKFSIYAVQNDDMDNELSLLWRTRTRHEAIRMGKEYAKRLNDMVLIFKNSKEIGEMLEIEITSDGIEVIPDSKVKPEDELMFV